MRASTHTLLAVLFFSANVVFAQQTIIKGFVAVDAQYDGTFEKYYFNLGEQDLFITSELSDKISFLGESVFKFDNASTSKFSIGIERIVIKYNYWRNHNFLIGKHHTPINYWNDTYHHGRVFFPTVFRPEIFNSEIIPLHTLGPSLQGSNLTKIKLGYDILVGNGIGAHDGLPDINKAKSITAAIHAKPIDGMRIGFSYYYDEISPKTKKGGDTSKTTSFVYQTLYSGSIAYFKNAFEFLAEATYAYNKAQYNDTTKITMGYYVYAGYRWKKLVSYVRYDQIDYTDRDPYYGGANITVFTGGLRYEINYLAVVKLEYQYKEWSGLSKTQEFVNFQFAIGF